MVSPPRTISESSVRNHSALRLSPDEVFSDHEAVHPLATVAGNVTDGFEATLTVPFEV